MAGKSVSDHILITLSNAAHAMRKIGESEETTVKEDLELFGAVSLDRRPETKRHAISGLIRPISPKYRPASDE